MIERHAMSNTVSRFSRFESILNTVRLWEGAIARLRLPIACYLESNAISAPDKGDEKKIDHRRHGWTGFFVVPHFQGGNPFDSKLRLPHEYTYHPRHGSSRTPPRIDSNRLNRLHGGWLKTDRLRAFRAPGVEPPTGIDLGLT